MHPSHCRPCCFNDVLNEHLHCQTPFFIFRHFPLFHGVQLGWFSEHSANQLEISPDISSWFAEHCPKVTNLELIRLMFVAKYTRKISSGFTEPTITPEIWHKKVEKTWSSGVGTANVCRQAHPESLESVRGTWLVGSAN